MAVPARQSADDPAPEDPEKGTLDPRKLVWADVRSALVTQIGAVGLAVAEMAARPGDAAALEMARLNLAVLESLGEMARRWVVDEKILEAVRQQTWDEAVAWCKAHRRRLEVAGGGRA
jgi:hypothetical protein